MRLTVSCLDCVIIEGDPWAVILKYGVESGGTEEKTSSIELLSPPGWMRR